MALKGLNAILNHVIAKVYSHHDYSNNNTIRDLR